MKRSFTSILSIVGLALCLALPCAIVGSTAFVSGCAAPAARTTQVKTLGVIGASVDASMKVAVGLLQNHQITVAQWQQVAAFHDQKFLPSYNLAVASVQANLDSIASPDLILLATQFTTLVAQLTAKT